MPAMGNPPASSAVLLLCDSCLFAMALNLDATFLRYSWPGRSGRGIQGCEIL